MDFYGFASLAHIRILLIPVGSIHPATFEKCVAEIRTFHDIRLGDIPTDSKGDKGFMPNPLSTGHLHLSFPTRPPPASHAPLSLLRPSNFPLAVIGLAACSQSDSISIIHSQFHDVLSGVFPPDSVFPLAKNCFVFEDGDGAANLDPGESVPGLVVIPSLMGNKQLYIGTLLADLCSHILGEFGVLAQMLESSLGNEYLNSGALSTLPPASDFPRSLDIPAKRDTLPPIPSRTSQPELAATIAKPPPIKRNTSLSAAYRQSTPVPKKRLPGIGVASSHGRFYKITGDLFLLAGLTEDALTRYTEALPLLKFPQDSLWYASALEGMATTQILDAWSVGHDLNTSLGSIKEPWADISEKLHQAIAIYFKTPTVADAEQHLHLMAYLYTCAVLREASLLFCIWSSKGWGPLAFTAMLHPGPMPYLPPTLTHGESRSLAYPERLSSASGISRSLISSVLAQAHGPWLLHIGPVERIALLETIAGMYASLGYRRKEAYILREVLGCILDLIVCGREEDGFSRLSSPPILSGLAIQGFSPGVNQTEKRGAVGVRQNESKEGNESILRLLKHICRVLGVDLEAVRLVKIDAEGRPTITSNGSSTIVSMEEDTSMSQEDSFGWPELQVGIIREAIAVAEALPDEPSVAQFALSALKTLSSLLHPGDQYHLYSTSARALATARRRGDNTSVEYWSGRPVISIALSPLSPTRIPIEKPVSAADATLDFPPILSGVRDPFLYNPRKATTTQEQILVVQNENLDFVVTLRNPYVFDMEFQTLGLSTVGVPFDSEPIAVNIPANSLHPVTITGKALESGVLRIRGCFIRAPGGALKEFTLPLSTDEEEDRLARKRDAMQCERGRSKYSGLEAFPWEKANKRESVHIQMPSWRGPTRFLECKVIEEQPLLRIRRSSVTHGAVMLYNGEMSVIRITLENISALPIDVIRFSFDDSTIAPAQQALADGNLSVFDMYETEYDLLHRPVFSWTSRNTTKVLVPGQTVTHIVDCYGKVGCTSGTIHVSYACLTRPHTTASSKPPDVFYTRQLSYPVVVTVYHMLECHGMDIIPFPDFASLDIPSHLAICSVGDKLAWCLFSVEVRNTYSVPFEITFERLQEVSSDTPPSSTSCIVPPGSTRRLVLPIKKFLLSEEVVLQPIPTLSNRQFVLTKSNLSLTEERAQRELFWYREELMKIVRGHWREAGGIRLGSLSLRQQRLTSPMLEALRTEAARLEMSLVQHQEGAERSRLLPQRNGKYLPRPNQFLHLCISITNLSLSSLVFTVDVKMEPAENIIFEGILKEIPVGRLECGTSTDIEIPLCFLCFGRFEIRAEVRTLGMNRNDHIAGAGQLTALIIDST